MLLVSFCFVVGCLLVEALLSLEGSISSAGLVKVRIIGVYTPRPFMPLSPTPGPVAKDAA